jgi:putative sterol carrier protein
MDDYEEVDRAIEYLKNKVDLAGFDRTVLLKIGDSDICLRVENSDITRAEAEKPDITIEMSEQTFRALASGELSPLKAYALRKVRVKASMSDMMFLTKLLR